MDKQIRNEISGMLIDINKVIEKLEFQVYQMQKDGLANLKGLLVAYDLKFKLLKDLNSL